MSFRRKAWKGYVWLEYSFAGEDWSILVLKGFKNEYLKYVMPVILHQICFIIILFKIRSRLWKRHIKPFRWS